MPSYMLLLYDNPTDFADLSPEEMQRILEQYQAWSEGRKAAGRLLGSDKLKDGEGRVMRSENGQVRVLDGPFSETKEVVGGYFTIQAADYDEAVGLARDCPHLGYGGMIEIREIDHLATGCQGAEAAAGAAAS